MKTPTTILTLLFSAVMGASAATPSLGFVTTEGSFQLDQSKIWGTATLFEGSVVETGAAPVEVHLSGGSEVELAAGSRVRFFDGRAVIEKGALRLDTPAPYRVEAHTFRIASGAAHTVAALRLEGPAGLAASASNGLLQIANGDGTRLADVSAGKAVTLTPQIGAPTGLTKLSGCVEPGKQSLVLTDQASNIAFALVGKGIEAQAGNRVEITGTSRPAGSAGKGTPGVVEVGEVKVLEKDGCRSASAAISAKATTVVVPAAAKPAGAIIGGVQVSKGHGEIEIRHDGAERPGRTSR
jgi:hypothetical protein